jgi:hypothetical protein
MDENPYKAPHGEPLVPPAMSRSGPRYESLNQRLISLALLLFVLFAPVLLVELPIIVSNMTGETGDAVSYLITLGAMIWLSAVLWLIVRVIRRQRSKSAITS